MSKRKHDDDDRGLKSSRVENADQDKADRTKRSKNSTREGTSKDDRKTAVDTSKSKRDGEKSEKKEKKQHQADSSAEDEPSGNGATSSGGDISLSIEETNKLRAKLGLKPLEVDSGATKSKSAKPSSTAAPQTKVADRLITNEVYVKPESAADKERTENIKLKLESRKEARKIERKLARIKTLGESSDEDDGKDASDWVIRQRTLDEERKLAEQRAKMFEDLDSELAGLEETPRRTQPLRPPTGPVSAHGLKVEHAFDEIEAGTQITLTLKDAPILAGSGRGRDDYDAALSAGAAVDDEDVLVSVDLMERERVERNRAGASQLAAWKRGLASLDDADAEGGAQGTLSKYDAPKVSSFRIGQQQDELKTEERVSAAPFGKLPLPNRRKIDADESGGISTNTLELRVARDFLNEDEMAARFKKRRTAKSTKEHLRRDNTASNSSTKPQAASASGSGSGGASSKVPASSYADVDEEAAIRGELEELLERTRQAKLRELKTQEDSEMPDVSVASALRRLRPIAEFINLQPQSSSSEAVGAGVDFDALEEDESNADGNSRGLDFNATSEFCKKVAAKQTELVRRRAELEAGSSRRRNQDEDMAIDSDDDLRDREMLPQEAKPSVVVKNERNKKHSGHKSHKEQRNDEDTAEIAAGIKSGTSSASTSESKPAAAVLEEEPVLNSGLAAAIQVAFKKGYLDARTEQKAAGSRLTNLEAKQFQVEQKRYDDIDAKFVKRDRFASSAVGPFREKDDYKPNVKLQYVDESGKQLDAKAEFQRLSWRFHGKTSGKNKLEKREKKEKRVHALKVMDASDTPLGTADKLRRKLESEQQPFLVLSGGASSSSKS